MNYRADIDGLRAVAVISVIVYHYFPTLLPNGFLGVDIFFVISGFVITGSFSSYPRNISLGETLTKFYARRIRRLAPALIVCLGIFVTLLVLLISRPPMETFATAAFSLIGLSNLFLYHTQSDYFALDAQINPFTHTWSLGVEEQFYLSYPILASLIGIVGLRSNSKNIANLLLLFFLMLVSLIAYLIAHSSDRIASFYLSPYRFWELLIGCIAYLFVVRINMTDKFSYSVLFAFLILLLSLHIAFDYQPILIVIACFATASLLILLTANNKNIVGQLLSNSIVNYIGKISYSLYLYHWPFLVIAALTIGHSYGALGVALVLTFSSAIASYHFIENPIRYGLSSLSEPRIILYAVVAVVPLALGIGLGMHKLSQSYNNSLASIFDIQPEPARRAVPCNGAASVGSFSRPLESCLSKRPNGASGDIFLIGDSHAGQLTSSLSSLLQADTKKLFFINTESDDQFPRSFWSRSEVNNDLLLEHVLKVADRGDYLFVAFHRGRLNEQRDTHISLKTMIRSNKKTINFVDNFSSWMPRFIDKGVKVILILDTPLLSYVTTVQTCALQQRLWGSNSCTVKIEQDRHTRKRQELAFEELRARFPSSIFVFDPLPYLYGSKTEFNPVTEGGAYRMLDWNHLSDELSFSLVEPFRELTEGLPVH
ncbi:MAG: acyltransferase family protein [Alphaproteobacteria bacterium]